MPSGFLIALAVVLVAMTIVAIWLRPRWPVWFATFRGARFAKSHRHREALAQLRRAVRLDPGNQRASALLWEVHKDLDSAKLASDPGLADVIDPNLCLHRAAQLLSEPPSANRLAEAVHLLNLVESREPALLPAITYWRAVAAMHERDTQAAARHLSALLDPSAWKPDDLNRRAILYSAWQLALTQKELEHLVGQPQLALPGRRLEAISAVEIVLADTPQDTAAWGMKRTLYAHLTELDLAVGQIEKIDSPYVEQLGLALANDPQHVGRGAEFLAIAARDMPAEAPRLFLQAAEALQKHGDSLHAATMLERGHLAGQTIGVAALSESGREAFFAIVKHLGDAAFQRTDLAKATEHYQKLSEYDRSGIETLRTLAELHERRGDALGAFQATARALVYNAKDADLLARRDRYLYSIEPKQWRDAPEPLRQAVDLDYCIATARRIVDMRDADAPLLDWAKHLLDVVITLRPGDIPARVLSARMGLRLGDRERVLQMLEDVRHDKPPRFASSADEDAWQQANKLLGDLYLNEYDRPDLAVQCFTDYRSSSRSGADTLYKLGLAHERLDQRAKAAQFFEMVAGYEEHPLNPEARAGLRRVRES
ncbi:MAG: tetratricopeptide repeat protein [Gemmataceae bacterium]